MGNKSSKSNKKQPAAMDDLLQSTMFTEEEIKSWYKNFLKDFPNGQVTEEQFKALYSQQFPNGDASKFAEHVFRTFDKDSDHTLDFKEFMIALSTTARGGTNERLKWAFQMYDVDENGYISREECEEIIKAIYKMRLKQGTMQEVKSAQVVTNYIFDTMDKNKDGKLSLDEFVEGAKTDTTLVTLLSSTSQ